MNETLKIDKDLAFKAFKILLARSDGTPAGILWEFHKAFVEFSNSDFKESDHPRDKDGKFTDKGEGSESNKTKSKTFKDISKFLGTEYKGVKGQKAIALLMEKKGGWVRNAFYRKEIGSLALIWGNKKMGLRHIIKRRHKTGQNLRELLESLPNIITKGKIELAAKSRLLIRYAGKTIVVSPKDVGGSFIVTAYFDYK